MTDNSAAQGAEFPVCRVPILSHEEFEAEFPQRRQRVPRELHKNAREDQHPSKDGNSEDPFTTLSM